MTTPRVSPGTVDLCPVCGLNKSSPFPCDCAQAPIYRDKLARVLSDYWFWDDGLNEKGREKLLDKICAIGAPSTHEGGK